MQPEVPFNLLFKLVTNCLDFCAQMPVLYLTLRLCVLKSLFNRLEFSPQHFVFVVKLNNDVAQGCGGGSLEFLRGSVLLMRVGVVRCLRRLLRRLVGRFRNVDQELL